jgi:hypothetical protein
VTARVVAPTFGVRRALAAVAAGVLSVTLAGCSGAASGDPDAAVHDTGSSPTTSATSTGADQSGSTPTSGASSTTSPASTLPPGDPGTDAPGTDDPNGDLGNEGGHPGKNAAKTSVPPTAVLDTETVSEVAGGGWTASTAPADSCTVPHPTKAVAARSSQLTGANTAAGSRLVETVSTHHGDAGAVAAVHALERRLTSCHATSASDPRIGDASVQVTLTAPDGTVTIVTAAAVEGVTFVLSGWGPVTAPRRWSALTDIALGSTCVATIEGCH